MSTYLTFRLFNRDQYKQLESVLEALTTKNHLLPAISMPLQRTLEIIESETFQNHNREFDLLRTWPALVEKAFHLIRSDNPAGLTVDESVFLNEIVIAVLCMPSFQFYYTPFSNDISENCMILGQWDEGLLFRLRQNNSWFDSLFSWDFPFIYGKYSYGNSMALLSEDQLQAIGQALQETVAVCSEERELVKHHRRFNDLVKRAFNNKGYTLALNFE